MKKSFKTLFCLVLTIYFVFANLLTVNPVSASSKTITKETIHFENGDYCVVKTTEIIPDITTLGTTKTKYAEKSHSYYNATNTLCWVYTLHGTFMYDNSTLVVCSDTYHEIDIRRPKYWLYDGGKHWKKANTAYGTATFQLMSSSAKKTAKLQISCTKHGVIS